MNNGITTEPRVVPVNEIGNEAESAGTDIIEILSPSTRAEVDVQIVTAKRYPRSIRAFKEQALAMATLDEETASGCFYCLPRGGKPIEGPSARLAEIVLSAWGNIRADARVIDTGARELTAEGVCWDLEKNVAVRVQVRRRITTKEGKRFNDDMIVVTGNAACAIALRNAVFKVVPMAFTRAIYHAARDVAVGNAQTLAAKRAAMVEYFGKMGVRPEQVCAAVGKPGVEDITLDDLVTLKGLATAIKEGDTTVDETFAAEPKPSNKPDPAAVAAAQAKATEERLRAEQAPTTIGSDVEAAKARVEEIRKEKAAKPAAAPSSDSEWDSLINETLGGAS